MVECRNNTQTKWYGGEDVVLGSTNFILNHVSSFDDLEHSFLLRPGKRKWNFYAKAIPHK